MVRSLTSETNLGVGVPNHFCLFFRGHLCLFLGGRWCLFFGDACVFLLSGSNSLERKPFLASPGLSVWVYSLLWAFFP